MTSWGNQRKARCSIRLVTVFSHVGDITSSENTIVTIAHVNTLNTEAPRNKHEEIYPPQSAVTEAGQHVSPC